ncbi:MAG: hypothetical protein V4723_03830 [Pseudomonadota bacterium]
MPSKPPTPDPAHPPSMINEADIGSGEINPGQQETDEIIRQIPPLPDDDKAPSEQAQASSDGAAQGQPGTAPAGPP